MRRPGSRRRCAWIAASAGLAASTVLCTAAASCTAPRVAAPGYRQRAMHVAARLGAPSGYPVARQWRLQPEASALVAAGRDVYGRPLRLAPRAATALEAMLAAATRDGVTLQVVSGFRSFRTQRQLLRRKLDHGRPLAAVLRVNALPGYSEHHSGCALDLTTPGVRAADATFAATPAFAWLSTHAGRFGFTLSYPAGNAHGIDFEPWHWRYTGIPPAGASPLALHARDAGALAGAAPRSDSTVQGYP
jgi:zinc D-Ala-D-Ala carboxypeptidase